MRRWPAVGVLVLAGVFALLLARAEVPPRARRVGARNSSALAQLARRYAAARRGRGWRGSGRLPT
jgi:hypothetical protein